MIKIVALTKSSARLALLGFSGVNLLNEMFRFALNIAAGRALNVVLAITKAVSAGFVGTLSCMGQDH